MFKISFMKRSNVCVSWCEKHLELGSSATVERAVSCYSTTVHHFRSYCLPKPTWDTTEEIKIERRMIIFSMFYRKCAGIGARLPWVLILFLDQKIALPLHGHPLCISADPLFCGTPFVSGLNLTLFHTQPGFSCCCYNKLQIWTPDSPNSRNCYCYSLGTWYCFRNWDLGDFLIQESLKPFSLW